MKIKSKEDKSNFKILKINQMKKGKYEVYLDILPIPIKMNERYLEAVLSELHSVAEA